jgi:hypothetical protein
MVGRQVKVIQVKYSRLTASLTRSYTISYYTNNFACRTLGVRILIRIAVYKIYGG